MALKLELYLAVEHDAVDTCTRWVPVWEASPDWRVLLGTALRQLLCVDMRKAMLVWNVWRPCFTGQHDCCAHWQQVLHVLY